MEHAAPAEMESLFVDESTFLKGLGGSEEENYASRSFVAAIYLFAHLIPASSWFLGARPTRSRIRGPVVKMIMI